MLLIEMVCWFSLFSLDGARCNVDWVIRCFHLFPPTVSDSNVDWDNSLFSFISFKSSRFNVDWDASFILIISFNGSRFNVDMRAFDQDSSWLTGNSPEIITCLWLDHIFIWTNHYFKWSSILPFKLNIHKCQQNIWYSKMKTIKESFQGTRRL